MCQYCGYTVCPPQCPTHVYPQPCNPCTQETGCKIKVPAECVTIDNTTVKDFLQCTNLLNYIYNCLISDPVQYAKFCSLWAACNGQQTCSAPANISVGAIDSDSAVVTWQVLSGVTYEVFLNNVSVQANAVSPLTLSGLTPNTSYTVRVTSTCSNSLTNFATAVFSTSQVGNLVFSHTRTAGDTLDLTGSINGAFTSINWGDGTTNTALSHVYASSGTYTVSIVGSTTSILFVDALNLITITAIPTTVTSIDISNNPLLTSIPSIAALTGLLSFVGRDTGLTVPPSFATNTLLNTLRLEQNAFSGTLALATNTALIFLQLTDNAFTDVTGLNAATNIYHVDIARNNLPVSVVNNILQQLDAHTVINGVCTLDGQIPAAAPTGAGATSKANLIGDGWTVTTD